MPFEPRYRKRFFPFDARWYTVDFDHDRRRDFETWVDTTVELRARARDEMLRDGDRALIMHQDEDDGAQR